MKYIKKFERFISEELVSSPKPKTADKVEVETKPSIKTATDLEVAEKFISLLRQKGDDVKKYIEKQ